MSIVNGDSRLSGVLRRNLINTYETLVRRHQGFYSEVIRLHEESPLKQRGHDPLHDRHVVMYGLLIAEGNEVMQEDLFLAATIHSIDRLFPRGADKTAMEAASKCLDLASDITDERKAAILDAFAEHGKKNDDNDSQLTIMLKDADRCANFCLGVIIRSGQMYHDLPPVEVPYLREKNPESTYRNPTSVLEDLRGCFDWLDWMRTPMGKTIANNLAHDLRWFVDRLALQYEELGLDDVTV